MRLADLTGRRVALLGLGIDVRAALPKVLAAAPAGLMVVDDGGEGLDEAESVSLGEAALRAEVILRSPGFPRYQPELEAALGAGASMTTPLDLWLGTFGPERTVVGVTGTKGKSTTTALIGHLAAEAGCRVGLAGNLGVPVFADGWDAEAPVVVLEVSSYQAADLHHVPDVAVVTFLAEDHLSWHGGRERYVADKLRVVRNEGGTAARVLVCEHGGSALDELRLLGATAEVVPAPVQDEVVVPQHRLENAAVAGAALAAACGIRVGDDDIRAAARSSLPGRLDVCPGPEGLLCVDDALASNPSAAAAGLAWLRALGHSTVVILGGLDRGVDPGPLIEEVARWSGSGYSLGCITLPDNGVDLAERCGVAVLASAETVADAVSAALAGAGPGAAVLFAPGAPTPPRFGNWETRSAEFRSALVRLS